MSKSSELLEATREYPEIYKGFYIRVKSNNKMEGVGRNNQSIVKNTWDELKKAIDGFWMNKELSPEEHKYSKLMKP